MDTTKAGFKYRLLVIGVAYKKRAIPLGWSLHRGSKGHLKVAEQIKLFRYVKTLLPPRTLVCVVGDSEFEQLDLLNYLGQQGWTFVMRQKGSHKVQLPGQTGWSKINHFSLKPGQTRFIGWVRLTEKHDMGWFWLVLHWRLGEKDPWYLIANYSGQRSLLKTYSCRMWLDETFGDLKGHGFDLAKTHLRSFERLNRLVLAVFLAFSWLTTLGSWVVKRGFRHFVDHNSRRDKSYFRIGWHWFIRCFVLDKPIPFQFIPYFRK